MIEEGFEWRRAGVHHVADDLAPSPDILSKSEVLDLDAGETAIILVNESRLDLATGKPQLRKLNVRALGPLTLEGPLATLEREGGEAIECKPRRGLVSLLNASGIDLALLVLFTLAAVRLYDAYALNDALHLFSGIVISIGLVWPAWRILKRADIAFWTDEPPQWARHTWPAWQTIRLPKSPPGDVILIGVANPHSLPLSDDYFQEVWSMYSRTMISVMLSTSALASAT